MKQFNDAVQIEIAKEKRLFELISEIGEGIYDKVHIIEHSHYTDDDRHFRVYHGNGFCWDVKREQQFDEHDNLIEPYYEFDEFWDGFKQSGIDLAIAEMEKVNREHLEFMKQ